MEHNLTDLFKLEHTLLEAINNKYCSFSFLNNHLRLCTGKGEPMVEKFYTTNDKLNKFFEELSYDLNKMMIPVWVEALKAIRLKIENEFDQYRESIKNGG